MAGKTLLVVAVVFLLLVPGGSAAGSPGSGPSPPVISNLLEGEVTIEEPGVRGRRETSHRPVPVEEAIPASEDDDAHGQAGPFTDLEGHWAKKEVGLLVALGVVVGIDGDNFYPDAPVTRAQFTVMMSRALGLEELGPSGPSYADVDPAAWYSNCVEAAREAGLVEGVGAGCFAPDLDLTRQELFVLAARLLEFQGLLPEEPPDTQVLAPFSDAGELAPWAEEAATQTLAAGVVTGFPGGRLAPLDKATRAQGAVVLGRILRLMDGLE